MSRPRVGDKGTKITLDIVENGTPINLQGAAAVIEIIHNGQAKSYIADIGSTSISYTGKPDDELWPEAGKYIIRGIITWDSDREFMTDDVVVIAG